MIALDICEPDNIEPTITNSTTDSVPTIPPASNVTVSTPPTPPTPVAQTTEEKPLTSGSGNASTTQIRQLKDLLLKLREKDPSKEDMIAQIAVQTNGFTTLSKADCETLVIKIGEMLKEGE